MTRPKFITVAIAASVFAGTFSSLPTAGAIHLHEELRNDRPICVSMSTESERQITRDHYRAQLREYEVLQAALRAEFSEFSQHYADFDRWTAQGYATNDSRFYNGLTAIQQESGFTLYEASFFAVKGTAAYRGLEDFAEKGFSLEMEFAPEWSRSEMANYPESDVPVIPVGDDWTIKETSNKTVDAYTQLTTGLPIGAFNVLESSVSNLSEFLKPRKEALAESRQKYEAVISPSAILQAAQTCQTLYLTGELSPQGPTITETPRETTTVPTVTETPEPVPSTTTVTEPVATVTQAPVTTTVTEPVATVTQAPVTTTVTEPVVTVTQAPVTTTVTEPVVTVTQAPVTTTVTEPVVTVTQAPVTTTVTEPVVTVTQAPSTTAQAPSPAAEGSSMGLMAGLIAALAAIGGIAVFMANNLGLLQTFF